MRLGLTTLELSLARLLPPPRLRTVTGVKGASRGAGLVTPALGRCSTDHATAAGTSPSVILPARLDGRAPARKAQQAEAARVFCKRIVRVCDSGHKRANLGCLL
jgi:hypothetical protein